MAPSSSNAPPSQDHDFSTSLFAMSGATPSLSKPLMPTISSGNTPPPMNNQRILSASPSPQPSRNSPARSTHYASPEISNRSSGSTNHSNNPYNDSMLTPHRGHTGSSPFGSSEYLSEKTTPSFDPLDIAEDFEMANWDDDTTLNSQNAERTGPGMLTGNLDDYVGSSKTAPTTTTTNTIDSTAPQHHTWPLDTIGAMSPSPMKRHLANDEDEPIITHIRRAGTDGSSASWMVSPIVKVEDYESSEGNLTLSIESCSTDTRNTKESGSGEMARPLQPERRPRSHSDVGVRGIQRDDDGVWGGLSPEMRKDLASNGLGLGIGQGEYLPMNLNEIEQFRKVHEKNMEVEEWLRRSPQLPPRGKGKGLNSERGGLSVPKRDRRSKSISDFRFDASRPRDMGSGNINGDVFDDDEDSDDISPMGSDWQEGSLDAWADDEENNDTSNTVSSPPVDPKEMDIDPPEEYDPNKDPNLLPKSNQFYSSKPWRDDPTYGPTPRGITNRNQPYSSNAAIRRFKEANDNLETASRVATFGSARNTRGMTTQDADKFVNTEGILKRLSFGSHKDKEKSPKDRKPSIFEFPFKRQGSTSGEGPSKSPLGGHSRTESGSNGAFAPPRWRPSWAPQRKHKLSIDTAIGAMTGHLAAVGAAQGETTSATSGGTSPIPWSSFASLGPPPAVGMKRTRSKSDLSYIGSTLSSKLIKPRPIAKPEFGLATMMQQHGGPPTIPITSSPKVGVWRRHTFGSSTTSIPNVASVPPPAPVSGPAKTLQEEAAGLYDSDEDDEGDVTMTKPTKKIEIKEATFEEYVANINELTPGLAPKLVERIAYEQVKRYKKLQDHKTKHSAAIARGDCPNKNKCLILNPRGTPQPSTISSGAPDGSEDNSILAAQYPFGVPDPPTSRLPAEFECTICFKVKKFSKPSDWTKHVHEDVQPFTCTFPDCTEPKSFKRKADWVRHENERHRHLEWWKCNQTDCQHICYRKDNFVQHLVREHKFPEPKVKAAKAAQKAKAGAKGRKDGTVDPLQEQADKVLAIVELCHNETRKEPSGEKCRFCGATCTSWKKLTVHLARHMEQISLPILDLLKNDTKGASLDEALSPQSPGATTPTPVTVAAAAPPPSQGKASVGMSPGTLYPQHYVVPPTAPTDTAASLSPSTPLGGIGYYHNPPPVSAVTSSTLPSSSPQMSLANFTYIDQSHRGNYLEHNFLDQQQGKHQTTNGNGAYYPSPSGSVSPYLLPHQNPQTSPLLMQKQQQRLSGAQTPPMLAVGSGFMDPGRFAGTTPGTTPPRSSHSMRQFSPPQQQMGLTGMNGLGGGMNPMNANMSMLNMSLPTTSVSMNQLQYTSSAPIPGLGHSSAIGAGSVGLGLEQMSMEAMGRLQSERSAYPSSEPMIRPYQASGGHMVNERHGGLGAAQLGAFPMGGMDMNGIHNDDANNWPWEVRHSGGGTYGVQ